MTPATAQLDRLVRRVPMPAAITLACMVVGVAAVVGWRFAHPSDVPASTTIPVGGTLMGGAATAQPPDDVPDQVWTVSLRDDLFPPPPPEPAPAPLPKPPELGLRVIAIGDRGVFVHDEVAGEHRWLRAGGRSGSGAVVKSIGEALVVFELDGRQLQREVER